jgi:hypothetical protein
MDYIPDIYIYIYVQFNIEQGGTNQNGYFTWKNGGINQSIRTYIHIYIYVYCIYKYIHTIYLFIDIIIYIYIYPSLFKDSLKWDG